ncbi:hypothetical protein E2C01_040078 [Portunus trituberculatus]|uniref:Uncharacterized protein n=1 Tax=Portunus trituberculatus TaxID=210409 RepID=A0A5B7FN01_PORTR|nr:hypothetical protein [Portunus trituberculatus]
MEEMEIFFRDTDCSWDKRIKKKKRATKSKQAKEEEEEEEDEGEEEEEQNERGCRVLCSKGYQESLKNTLKLLPAFTSFDSSHEMFERSCLAKVLMACTYLAEHRSGSEEDEEEKAAVVGGGGGRGRGRGGNVRVLPFRQPCNALTARPSLSPPPLPGLRF